MSFKGIMRVFIILQLVVCIAATALARNYYRAPASLVDAPIWDISRQVPRAPVAGRAPAALVSDGFKNAPVGQISRTVPRAHHGYYGYVHAKI